MLGMEARDDSFDGVDDSAVLLVTVLTSEDAHVPDAERAKIQDLPGGFCRVTLDYGFMEVPSVPEGLRDAVEHAQLSCGSLPTIS
jgi:K+ transporter